MTTVVLLAAGRSQRFGPACKLQAIHRGKPLVRHAADAIIATGLPALAVVSDQAVADLLPEFRIVRSIGPQSRSLKAGLQQVADWPALIVLGDMPHVDGELLMQVAKAPAPAVVTDGSSICPPVCLPQSLLSAVAALKGDQGAGAFLRTLPDLHRILVCPQILKDIDLCQDIENTGF